MFTLINQVNHIMPLCGIESFAYLTLSISFMSVVTARNLQLIYYPLMQLQMQSFD